MIEQHEYYNDYGQVIWHHHKHTNGPLFDHTLEASSSKYFAYNLALHKTILDAVRTNASVAVVANGAIRDAFDSVLSLRKDHAIGIKLYVQVESQA